MKQPDPIVNNNVPIVDLVIQDIVERKRIGIERYGVALQANNGRNPLWDAYEESMDMTIYLRQALEENSKYKKALELISANTYGTELCNTDEDNNKILADHFFYHQNIARQALK